MVDLGHVSLSNNGDKYSNSGKLLVMTDNFVVVVAVHAKIASLLMTNKR